LLIFTAALVFLTTASPQQTAPQSSVRAGLTRVFLDCQQQCDFDFMRTEVKFVDYVRDRKDADVHVLVTTQGNATGGQDFLIQYIGLGRFEGVTRTIRYSSTGTETSDERRRGFTRTFGLGLVPFLYDTTAMNDLRLLFDPPRVSLAPTEASAKRDPWNLWIFRLGSGITLNGESRGSERGIRVNLNANRTTDEWKIALNSNLEYEENTFKLSSGGEFTSVSKNWFARAMAIRSLGTDHWAAALRSSIGASTFENRDLATRAAAGIEYSFFPYAESTRRALYAQYTVGINRIQYRELTIFDKLDETVYDQVFETTLSLRQPWGSTRVSLEAANYLHDFSKHRVAFEGRMDVRLFRGFSLNLNGNASRVRDQLYLPKGGASDEEILLRLRRLQTSYRYGLSVGFNYQFGSIFNNVVNPRFEGF
jgi:hypothetical protein